VTDRQTDRKTDRQVKRTVSPEKPAVTMAVT
jgi:hypothetical protein